MCLHWLPRAGKPTLQVAYEVAGIALNIYQLIIKEEQTAQKLFHLVSVTTSHRKCVY